MHSATKKMQEYIIPKSMGGKYTIGVCEECNQARGLFFNYPSFKDLYTNLNISFVLHNFLYVRN